VLRNVYKDVALKRCGAKRHKKGIKGEPDLRGKPAASSAEKYLQRCDSQAVWSEATKEKDGLRKQAVKV
jgi:hypothetical protein